MMPYIKIIDIKSSHPWLTRRAEEAVLNLESVSGDYDKVHSEFTQLKVDYENVKSEHVRQTGIIIKYRACAEIKFNLLQDALKKMKVTQNDRSLTRNLVTEILHANRKTEEERCCLPVWWWRWWELIGLSLGS